MDRKFDHTANFQRVEHDGVTVGVRSNDGLLQYVASSKEGRDLAIAEGRPELIPARPWPEWATGAAIVAGGVLTVAAIRKARRRKGQ